MLTSVSSDYSTGAFASVDLSDWSITDELFVTASDAAVSADEGMVFQVNRLGYDNVRMYEPGSWGEPIWEQSVGDLRAELKRDVREQFSGLESTVRAELALTPTWPRN